MLGSLQYVCVAVLLASKVNYVARISDHLRETVQEEILNKFLLQLSVIPTRSIDGEGETKRRQVQAFPYKASRGIYIYIFKPISNQIMFSLNMINSHPSFWVSPSNLRCLWVKVVKRNWLFSSTALRKSLSLWRASVSSIWLEQQV